MSDNAARSGKEKRGEMEMEMMLLSGLNETEHLQAIVFLAVWAQQSDTSMTIIFTFNGKSLYSL